MIVRDVGVAGSNPATPTIRFTKPFKRLVNFLKLRKNMKKGLVALVSAGRFGPYRACLRSAVSTPS